VHSFQRQNVSSHFCCFVNFATELLTSLIGLQDGTMDEISIERKQADVSDVPPLTYYQARLI
jgi:hypothetical protein